MSHTPHELAEEFHDLANEMAILRQSDGHFAKLSDRYHVLNRAIHRAETDVEPTSDDHMVAMRKERLALKDQIFAYIKAQADLA
ncbi:YdcH family protein [Sulfitobacter pacificus]|uniref:DUF465 domain-containing protein n=1 Tax=Sulfitobacter pacificus TaxID=1499314 RepID=A0ABQ5VFE0_9RHOB|nr:YdcH family protein [Sulfitobacter pacificus]GLQ25282.1 hypothetical protein GCM10007927_00850 [Sulfitobacter pacificus]